MVIKIMDIIKGEILTEDRKTVIYPKTSIDQVKGAYLGDAKAFFNSIFSSIEDTTVKVSDNCLIELYIRTTTAPDDTWILRSNDERVNMRFYSSASVWIRRKGNFLSLFYITEKNTCGYQVLNNAHNTNSISAIIPNMTISPIWDIYDYTKLE